MHIVIAAWLFVVLIMALVQATAPDGSLLGAFFTVLLYGVLPLSIVIYVMGTPARRRARLRAEQMETVAAAANAEAAPPVAPPGSS